MSTQQNNSYYIIAFIFSLIGGLMVLFSDFGGWYHYYWGSGYERGYIYFNPAEPLSIVVIGLVVLCMFYSAYIAFLGIKGPVPAQKVSTAIYASIVALSIVIIGTIIFVVSVFDSTDWWLDNGFFAGFFSPLVSIFMFRMIKKN